MCSKYYISEVLIFSGANLSSVNCKTRILRLSSAIEYGQIPDRQTRFFSLKTAWKGISNVPVIFRKTAMSSRFWLTHQFLSTSWNLYTWRVKSIRNQRKLIRFNPLSANLTKWSNTLKQFVGNLPTNCLSVFDHFCKIGA